MAGTISQRCTLAASMVLFVSLCWLPASVSAHETAEYAIADILTRWSEASATEGPFEIRFQRYEYDSTFAVEERSEVILRGDGAGMIEWRSIAVEIPDGMTNEQKLDANGDPYEVRSGGELSWIWTPHAVVLADHDNKTRVIVDRTRTRPDGIAGRLFSAVADPPLRVTFPLPTAVDELQQDYRWETRERHDLGIQIRGYPREETLARDVQEVELILDEDTWLPVAYREVNGGNECVLMVEDRSTPANVDIQSTIDRTVDYVVIERISVRME